MAPQSVYPPDRQLKVAAAHLARIAKAGDKEIHPANKRHEQDVFRDRVIGLVLSLRERDRHSTGTKPGGLLPQAADAARRLDDAYARMNKQDRDWVERIKPSQIQFLPGEIKDIQSTISNLSMLLHSALNKTYPMPKSPLHQKLGMNGPQVRTRCCGSSCSGYWPRRETRAQNLPSI